MGTEKSVQQVKNRFELIQSEMCLIYDTAWYIRNNIINLHTLGHFRTRRSHYLLNVLSTKSNRCKTNEDSNRRSHTSPYKQFPLPVTNWTTKVEENYFRNPKILWNLIKFTAAILEDSHKWVRRLRIQNFSVGFLKLVFTTPYVQYSYVKKFLI